MSSPQDENTQNLEPTGRIINGFSRLGIFGLSLSFILNLLFDFSSPSLFALIAFAASTVLTWLICYTSLEPSLRWRFFATTLGKKISWYFYALCVLNLLCYLNSKAAIIIAIISSFFIIVLVLIKHINSLKQAFYDFMSTQLSLAAIFEFHKFQRVLRPFSILCSIALVTYAIILPIFFFHNESQNVAVLGFFVLLVISMVYWFLEAKIRDADMSRLLFYWLVYGLTIYKFVCSYTLLWLSCKINFGNLAKLELFGLAISVSMWIIAFLELMAFEKISAADQLENSEGNEDEEDFETAQHSFAIIITERAAQVFCLIFGVSLFSFIAHSGLGLSNAFFLLSLVLFLVYWHFHPEESFFVRDGQSYSKFCNSWKKALKVFVTGNFVFFLKNETNIAQSFSNEAEAQLYTTSNALGFITAICFCVSG